MIDIHTHVLPLLDDGSDGLESSMKMLRQAYVDGITKVICTPHFRGEYNKGIEEITQTFEALKLKTKEEGILIDLYLGQEIYLNKQVKGLLNDKALLTLNGTKYVLVELDFFTPIDVGEAVYELVNLGYIPVVAHVERYPYLSISDVAEIKAEGGLVQVNADSLVGKTKRIFARTVKRLIARDLVDFVASDFHQQRENKMKDAKRLIERKFGKDVAEKLFYENARKIIEG